ncbi:hypothetical protein ISN44_As07g020460 [Arabidopsis suecica]|uniref:Uncharacterized protein n=1 Tax=Arabidopsis suecica TaxID=45249 RepID=A0A8T2BVY2_ARASU|nr:hypothetical protein ISN44_As07g020460 [Arabidopsis suecica]
MGLDDIYDYGINSPLDYSSEEEEDSSYYPLQPQTVKRSLWSCDAEPTKPYYETELMKFKDHQNHSDQRLVKLERLVTELGEKKPLFNLAPELVVAVCFSMSVLVVALIMFIK